MQGPLGAAPGFTRMDCAAIIVEDAVTINCLHLNGVATLTPEFAGNIISCHPKVANHPLLVIFIKRDSSFSLAAITTLLADEYF